MIPVQRPSLGPAELEAVGRVFDSRWLGLGAVTKEFEDALRPHVGAKHVVAVNTGTSAIHLALDALGVQAGDEVILPSLTFVAAVQAVIATGAAPVFCEVNPANLNIDVDDALSRITERTRAIMPVHYGGIVCDMDELMAGAHERSVLVVDDAAHAFGSTYRGQKVGELADVSCFSFDPIKNITCGEGGAVTTNLDSLAERLLQKRILGIDNDTWARYRNERNWSYHVVTPGWRYHMSNINAAIGLAQLQRIDEFRARKQEIVARYDEHFRGLPGVLTIDHRLPATFPFFYIIRIPDGRRDALIGHLKERGIATGVHYIPNHLQPLFESHSSPLPKTEAVFEEIVTLPLYTEMTDADVTAVIDGVTSFVADA